MTTEIWNHAHQVLRPDDNSTSILFVVITFPISRARQNISEGMHTLYLSHL